MLKRSKLGPPRDIGDKTNGGNGRYRDRAEARLQTAETRVETQWQPIEIPVELYLPHLAGSDGAAARSSAEAILDWLVVGQLTAKLLKGICLAAVMLANFVHVDVGEGHLTKIPCSLSRCRGVWFGVYVTHRLLSNQKRRKDF